MILEKTIEAYLRNQVKKRGGIAFKFVSPGYNGVPDRLIVMPGGSMYFVEVKNERGRLSPMQVQCHKMLKALGVHVYVIWSKEDVDAFMEIINV